MRRCRSHCGGRRREDPTPGTHRLSDARHHAHGSGRLAPPSGVRASRMSLRSGALSGCRTARTMGGASTRTGYSDRQACRVSPWSGRYHRHSQSDTAGGSWGGDARPADGHSGTEHRPARQCACSCPAAPATVHHTVRSHAYAAVLRYPVRIAMAEEETKKGLFSRATDRAKAEMEKRKERSRQASSRSRISAISADRACAKPRSIPVTRKPHFSRTRSDARLSCATRALSGREESTARNR
jgi:hypothetical protein